MENQASFLDYAIGLTFLGAVVAGILWLCVHALRNSEDPLRLVIHMLLSLIVIPILISGYGGGRDPIGFLLYGGVAGLILAAIWAPHITAAIGKSVGSLYDGGNVPPEPGPFYSIAEGRRNAGEYSEAIEAIRAELAKFPTDFKGRMLLADIQAENLKDIVAAHETLQTLIAQPGHDSRNISFAMNRLADWHLKLDENVEVAKQAVQWIIDLFPGTEAAYQATQRLAHMDQLAPGAKARRIVVTEQTRYIALEDGFDGLKPPPEDFEATAARLIKRLEAQPDDNEARELLAILYARHFQRMDLACELIEQMLAQSGAPTSHRVHWFNLMVDLYITVAADPGAARQALQRIIETSPGTAEAEKAGQRLLFIDRDLKNQKEGATLSLGEYEPYIGLKDPKHPSADKKGA